MLLFWKEAASSSNISTFHFSHHGILGLSAESIKMSWWVYLLNLIKCLVQIGTGWIINENYKCKATWQSWQQQKRCLFLTILECWWKLCLNGPVGCQPLSLQGTLQKTYRCIIDRSIALRGGLVIVCAALVSLLLRHTMELSHQCCH